MTFLGLEIRQKLYVFKAVCCLRCSENTLSCGKKVLTVLW